jgi:hypothetical protein
MYGSLLGPKCQTYVMYKGVCKSRPIELILSKAELADVILERGRLQDYHVLGYSEK